MFCVPSVFHFFIFLVQVPYIFVSKLKDAQLTASPGASVTLNCIASFSPQRPPAYEWSKGATVLPGSNSSLTVAYKSATDTRANYHCVRTNPSAREVNCSSTYQCTASLPGMQVKDATKANVHVVLSKQDDCPIYCTYPLAFMKLSSILL